MTDRDLFDLYRERNELQLRLVNLDAQIRRIEHDKWRKFQDECAEAIAQGAEELTRMPLRGPLVRSAAALAGELATVTLVGFMRPGMLCPKGGYCDHPGGLACFDGECRRPAATLAEEKAP
jgi:hypothetical protein